MLTLYAKTGEIRDYLHIEASADGEAWSKVPYTVELVSDADTAWQKLAVQGVIPRDLGAQFFRVSFAGDGFAPEDLQLGHVYLAGVAIPESLELLPY
ncbi:MAG TPA: hypothetical protein GXX57_00335 [Firmicutes bacterium]|nr:hypothetical protein [Bacillota bacterium]